jgi:hypothetical protein
MMPSRIFMYVFILALNSYVDLISVTLRRAPPITVAVRSKARTIFARSNTEVVGSNPTRDMDVCMCLFCVCVVLCVSSGLATG